MKKKLKDSISKEQGQQDLFLLEEIQDEKEIEDSTEFQAEVDKIFFFLKIQDEKEIEGTNQLRARNRPPIFFFLWGKNLKEKEGRKGGKIL